MATPTARSAATETAPGDWLEPELATLTRDRFFGPAWMYERKFDGERCLAYRDGTGLRLMTRNRQQVNSTYPELAAALQAQEATDFVIDGEVVALQKGATSFSRLQQRLGVRAPDREIVRRVPVTYFVFDVLRAGGRDVRSLPLRERKRVLRPLLAYGGPVRYTVHRSRGGEAYWHHALATGWEGLVVKRADSRYVGGRSRDWLKFKAENNQEFVIGGFTDPQGCAERIRGAADRLLRRQREARVCREGRYRVRHRHPGQPARGAHRAGAEDSGVRPRSAAAVRGALGPPAARRADRVLGVDNGRSAPPPALPGAAARQGSAVGQPGAARLTVARVRPM